MNNMRVMKRTPSYFTANIFRTVLENLWRKYLANTYWIIELNFNTHLSMVFLISVKNYFLRMQIDAVRP